LYHLMGKRIAALPTLFVAVLILLISVVRTASVKYVFSQAPSPSPETSTVTINYELPEPDVTPEDPLWPVQALIDMGGKTAEEYLYSADIRLVSGKQMFDKGKIEEGILVLQKAEQYLAKASEATVLWGDSHERSEFLYTLSLASLKHRQILETILPQAPEDSRAVISKILDTPKIIYETSSSELVDSGLTAPEYPF